MKKIIAICLVLILCAGVFVGLQPDEYSFFTDDIITTKNPLISIDFDDSEIDSSDVFASTSAMKEGKYTAKLKLLGFLPIKTAEIKLIEKQNLIPLGIPFGVKLYTEGVIVVDITDFIHNGKIQNPAYEAGLREGDVIISYNGVKIKSNDDLIEQVKLSEGKSQKAVIKRNNLQFDIYITPVTDDADNEYRIGLWVRDSTAGIGMLTYYNKTDNTLAGLGHSISDVDTGLTMPVSTGELLKAKIDGVVKGMAGSPGELLGSFLENSTIGVLKNNTVTGLDAICITDEFSDYRSFPISLKSDIIVDKAQIICCVDGTDRQYYDIEIVKINNNLQETKNMVIKIVDEKLLSKTGGIVQGMSGSPIIQNGKLIGAVTHVFVDDPTRGYGIFIENMLS